MKCWASSVSECCATQSREHYLTKGLFSGKMLYVEGMPFLNGEKREIAKASLTKKCLCKKHNSLLSPYDDEAILFGKALEYAFELSVVRRNSSKKSFSLHTKSIDYDNFCRWLIKTYLGFVEFFNHPSLVNEDKLAELVFSNTAISNYVQLSIVMAKDEDFQISETVSVTPLYLGETTAGFRVQLYGVRVEAIFSYDPQYAQKPLTIKFNEYPKRKSCIVHVK